MLPDFVPECDLSKPYSKGEYNKFDDQEQYIRLSEGCPNRCPYCRESFENPEPRVFEIPEIVRNDVKILDMNLLSHSESLEIIRDLGRRKVNNKVVKYKLLCGIDFRFLNQELASALRQSRFYDIYLAWDWGFSLQKVLKYMLRFLLFAGYDPKNITFFILCNWKVSYQECLRKLDLCKVWGVKVADCYFDNQLSPDIKSVYWLPEEIKDFRARVRKHNQLIGFRIDPEV